jgi:hypothetical protein
MRRAVKKPGASLKRQLHVQTHLESNEPTADLVKLSTAMRILGKSSYKKAQQIKKSQFISHYAGQKQSVDTPKPHHPRPYIDWSDNPLSKSDAIVQMEEAFKTAIAHQPLSSGDASSIKKRHKTASIWTASAVLILLLGAGVSLNFTSLKIAYASSRAGFYASLPRNLPPGYNLSRLSFASNDVDTLFKNNNNQSTYSLIQRSTTWNSSSDLLNSYVAMGQANYQTASVNGLNVYMYGNNVAAWISHGIWYTFYGNNSISNSQILSIASSTT